MEARASNKYKYFGFFVLRDGVILQSMLELFDGPYELQGHVVSPDSDSVVYKAGVSPPDALMPVSMQLPRIATYFRRVLSDSDPDSENHMAKIIYGGLAKLFLPIDRRIREGNSHSITVAADHADILFGQGSRALSLAERSRMADTRFLHTMFGTDGDDWFPAMCSYVEKYTQ